MSLVSRKGQPDNPCRQHGDSSGCFTTGWQDTIELAGAIERLMKRDSQAAADVQRLFKRHAIKMPRFLRSGREFETIHYGDPSFAITPECSSGAPTWDLKRPGRYFHEQCNLYTRIAHL